MFEYDANLSYAPDDRHTEVRIYSLDKLDITTRKVLDVGVIAQVAMEQTGFEGSEDYSDLFDSIGILLEYAANRMLAKVYEDDKVNIIWMPNRVEDLHQALGCIEQFLLIGKLVK